MPTMFSGPIPGQSLTTAPGNAPWEQPSQFTNVDKAMDYLSKQMTSAKRAARTIALIDAGVPIEGLVRVTLFTGFTEGKWSYDLMVLLAAPLGAFMGLLYKKVTGKLPKKMTLNEGKADEKLAAILRGELRVPDANETVKTEEEAMAPRPEAPAPEPSQGPDIKSGIMGIG